jgi:hypothetical protein
MMMLHKAFMSTLVHHSKLLFLVMEMKRRFMLHLQAQTLQKLGLVNCLVCKAKSTKEWKIKEENWMQVSLQL